MSLNVIEEARQAGVETLFEPLDPPFATDVTILAEVAGGTVVFSTPVFVEGVNASGSVITLTKPNARFNLQITLAPGFKFQTGIPAILWATPPQRGYESNPFGTSLIFSNEEGTVAVIPSSTSAKGSPKLTTQFALVLVLVDSSNGVKAQSVIIDPTIVDDPNT